MKDTILKDAVKSAVILTILTLAFTHNTSLYPLVIFVWVCVYAFFIFMYFKEKHNRKRHTEEFMEHNNYKYACGVSFVSGLPLAEDLPVELYLSKDKLHINSYTSNNEYELPYSKIVSVQSTTKKEVYLKDKSTVGRGIVGGLIGGTSGAIIGTSSANKTETQNVLYIHIFYNDKDDRISSITFSSLNYDTVSSFLNSISPSIKNSGTIAL